MAERHLKLDLTEDAERDNVDTMRPYLSAWHEHEDEGPIVVLSIGPAWGAMQRHLTLKPKEARQLADMLTSLANRAEKTLIMVAEDAGL